MVVKNRKAHLLREETRNKLRQEVASGQCWYIALLKIVASCAEEERLIDEEAFDLWGLARKMALEVRDIVPEYELELFLQGRLPIKLSGEELANIIGPKVYSYHLNFFYGVVVEDALIHLTQNEILREGFFFPKHNLRDEAYLKSLWSYQERAYSVIYSQTRALALTGRTLLLSALNIVCLILRRKNSPAILRRPYCGWKEKALFLSITWTSS